MRADQRSADALAQGRGDQVNAVGLFAGRGDVILAMGLAILVGVWLGWYIHKFRERVQSRWKRAEPAYLKRMIHNEIRQGSQFGDAKRLYALVREAWATEFPEDNDNTTSAHLAECFEATQKWPLGKPPNPTR